MKRIFKLLLFVLSISTISLSCKKETDTNESNGIVGTWKLIETFNGYANGGSFTWTPVSIDYVEQIQFNASNQYTKYTASQASVQNCVGTYLLKANRSLDINSNCNTTTETKEVTELTSTTLILNEQVREGYIRYKYSRQ